MASLHRFTGETYSEAISKVKEALGPDAMIVSAISRPKNGPLSLLIRDSVQVLASEPEVRITSPEPAPVRAAGTPAARAGSIAEEIAAARGVPSDMPIPADPRKRGSIQDLIATIRTNAANASPSGAPTSPLEPVPPLPKKKPPIEIPDVSDFLELAPAPIPAATRWSVPNLPPTPGPATIAAETAPPAGQIEIDCRVPDPEEIEPFDVAAIADIGAAEIDDLLALPVGASAIKVLERQGLSAAVLRHLQEGPVDHASIRHRLEMIAPTAPAIEPTSPNPPVHAFVGPSGAGKTAFIASLATAYRGAGKRVAVLIADPMHRVNGASLAGAKPARSSTELRALITGYSGHDAILIDTPSDADSIREVGRMLCGLLPGTVHLVLRATDSDAEMTAQIEQFAALEADDLVVTHLDQATTWAGAVNACAIADCGISYAAFGTDPSAIEAYSSRRLTGDLLAEAVPAAVTDETSIDPYHGIELGSA